MNRRALSLLLCLGLLLSLCSGCGSSKEAPETAPAPTAATAPDPTAAPTPAAAPEAEKAAPAYYEPGDRIDDFTVTTFDGKTLSIYEILEEKDMILLNFWATWCGPCAMEFPNMQEAYEQYQDKIEILAVSSDPGDTEEMLAEYAAGKGLTFPVAPFTELAASFDYSSIPTSVVIDRFGTVCLIEGGAQIEEGVFQNLFDVFTAEDYSDSALMMGMDAEKASAEPESSEELSRILNGENGGLVFENSSSPYDWPMIVTEEDGREVLVSSNAVHSSRALVKTTVEAEAGDVISVSFKLRGGSPSGRMILSVDNTPVKIFSNERDWDTFAYAFEEAGSYEVAVSFVENRGFEDGAALFLDSIELLSGEAAAAALAQNPAYAAGTETRMKVLNETARKGFIYDVNNPDDRLEVYVIPDDTVTLHVTLDETVDPENAYIIDPYGESFPLLPFAQEDGYRLELTTLFEGGLMLSYALEDGSFLAGVDIIPSEERAEEIIEVFKEFYLSEGYAEEELPEMAWAYEDDFIGSDAKYTVVYTDQNGNGVPGVMCQVCDETTCQVFVSDANGVCSFTLPGYAYEIHTLKVPDGYEGDLTTVLKASPTGGEISIVLTKK